jgi:hypothetical protein
VYVLEHEIAEGRFPIEMAGNQPGYDIVSRNSERSNDMRYIEVKSTAGYWGAAGVSLSITQLEEAYRRGEDFWIYIVENIDNSNRRLFKIQNPAQYIYNFKFNDAWRDIAISLELDKIIEKDISDAIGPEDQGCEIHHTILGPCFLKQWIQKGNVFRVILWFEEDDLDIEYPWNPRTMKKING